MFVFAVYNLKYLLVIFNLLGFFGYTKFTGQTTVTKSSLAIFKRIWPWFRWMCVVSGVEMYVYYNSVPTVIVYVLERQGGTSSLLYTVRQRQVVNTYNFRGVHRVGCTHLCVYNKTDIKYTFILSNSHSYE